MIIGFWVKKMADIKHSPMEGRFIQTNRFRLPGLRCPGDGTAMPTHTFSTRRCRTVTFPSLAAGGDFP